MGLDVKYLKGELDPASSIGRGTIIEYVVMETLGECTKKKFDFKYDLYSEDVGEVNVKSSKRQLINISNGWNFNTKTNEYKPDYCVCVALDEYYSKILHVWIIPPEVITTQRIIIPDTERGLKKVKDYEVDASKYDITLQNIDISRYPEFRNVPKDKIDFSCSPLDKTPKCKKVHSLGECGVKVVGCRTISSEMVRKCQDCARAPHLSNSCTERLWYCNPAGPLMDQYYYEEVFE